MYACLNGAHALSVGFLHSQVCGNGVVLERDIRGSARRRPTQLNRPLSSFSPEKLPSRPQENTEPHKGPPKDTSREETSQRPHSRWWYGKDGELESTFPCPDCRGRGYIPCPLCDIATPDSSCTECHGKGLKTCSRCQGTRTILLQPVYEEIPWEENTASGPLREIEDDDVIDNMDIEVVPDRKSKRIYSPPSVEVREKIRQALKSLDARTGSVTRRMRRIHNDPVLNAKRIAAIKKAKSTEAARKLTSEKLRLFFQDPRNRILRSFSVKGADYFCSHCGAKGHRRNYCPEFASSTSVRSHRCSLCGQKGHKRTTCQNFKENIVGKKRAYRCSICKEVGHNARSCQKTLEKSESEHDDG